MPLITPPEIDDTVRDFAKTISANDLIVVPVKPVPSSMLQRCFGSVTNHVMYSGGRMVLGWIIWIHPKVLIEAEHHAVWESPEGDLIDITAKADDEKEIVFLPDETATLRNGSARNNVRKALANDLSILAMIKAADKYYPYFVKADRGDYMDAKTVKTAQKALAAKNAAITAFRAKYPD